MHYCISSANSAEDHFTYPELPLTSQKDAHNFHDVLSHVNLFQFILISLSYTKIDVKLSGDLCTVFLDNDSLQLHRDAHLSPWSQSILHT